MTTNEPPPPALCKVCGDLENDHDRIHPFTPQDSFLPSSVFRNKVGEQTDIKLPFDPVLRQALLDASVVTADDLRAAQAKVEAIMTGKFDLGGARDGDGPEQGK